MSKEVLDKVLSLDPIYEMEKAAGKHHDDFSQDEMGNVILFNLFSNEMKTTVLKHAGDTYFNISWKDFILLIENHGFKNALEYRFTYNDFGEDETGQAVLYYREDGLIIWATSYHNKLNGGTLYGELIKNQETPLMNLPDYSGGFYKNNRLSFTTDVREGLFRFIERMEENGVFAPVWGEKNRFLWFVDYKEEKEPGYDYKKISNEKISAAADGLKQIVMDSI